MMNKHLKQKDLEVEPVMSEPSKMLNELGKAVDLDEIMGQGQNLWITAKIIARTLTLSSIK